MASTSSTGGRSRALRNWERVAVAAIDQGGGARLSQFPGATIPESVPASLEQASRIETILQVAKVLEAENPDVARILCEHAYSLSQQMDPNSEGKGVLQFKTGLHTIIKKKLAKKDGATTHPSEDIETLRNFYFQYKKKHQVTALQETPHTSVVDKAMLTKKNIFTTLNVLKEALDALLKHISEREAALLVPANVKRQMESDVADFLDLLKTYNILPLEVPGYRPAAEVEAAVQELDLHNFHQIGLTDQAVQELNDVGLQQDPSDRTEVEHKKRDIFDILGSIFGFQKDNVRNQREHLVLLLANAQMQLAPLTTELQLDKNAIDDVHRKVLRNYIEWCYYLRISSVRDDSKQRKLVFVSLYLLIWGEAANVRFLPECICYLFHNMANEFLKMLANARMEQAQSCGSSFLTQIITPLYKALQVEVEKSNGGKASHSKWCNYDDFNEFFWTHACFKKLGWGVSSPFFNPKSQELKMVLPQGKTSFVEHRTFLHLYRSFHRLWILLVMMLQGLAIWAFSSSLSFQTLKILLSLSMTYFVMQLIESVLDAILMWGAYRSCQAYAVIRIFVRLIFFGTCAGGIFFLYWRMLQQGDSNTLFFRVLLLAIVIYLVLQLIISFAMHVPLLRRQAKKLHKFRALEWIAWLYQDRYFVGRGLYERPRDYIRYVLFWVAVLGCKFTFSYFLQIKPLVGATREIVNVKSIPYKWHDFVSQGNYNALAVFFLWAPVVLIYLLDISIWYAVFSAILGGLVGARERLGVIRSLEMFRKWFDRYPEAFVNKLQYKRRQDMRLQDPLQGSMHDGIHDPKPVQNAEKFAPFWNEIINCLREEDYINNLEKDLLLMPSNKARLGLVQWPLFLVVSKVHLAMNLVDETKSLDDLRERLATDDYMLSAVQEAYNSLCSILSKLLSPAERVKNFEREMDMVGKDSSVEDGSFYLYLDKSKIQTVVTSATELTGLLLKNRSPEHRSGAVKAIKDLYQSVPIFNRKQPQKLGMIELRWPPSEAEKKLERRLHYLLTVKESAESGLRWPISKEEKELVRRLHHLLTVKESPESVPKNLEARRRLQFFSNSLFMNIPTAPSVKAMKSFCVYTPYDEEPVLYSEDNLSKENEDGISTLFYLQKIFPDEWSNFLERILLEEVAFERKFNSKQLGPEILLKLRLWASYRGQTLGRTVRGMMYYRKALMLQSFLESADSDENVEEFERSTPARSQADLKFTYVVTCQKYGEQKKKKDPKATDILYLMQQNEALRIAFVEIVDAADPQQKEQREYYSKLVKGSGDGKDQEIYSIKLPGNPVLGEEKPENQNHAIIFTRGEAVQTIDMNQDNYFEEALKMRNLLEEFDKDHGVHRPTILGVREHIFTGSVSSLASFMSKQETTFVTLGQRVLANPLKVRMHYGHTDVFDRLFHLSRGGISKASKVINISEGTYAGFNSTLRNGNVTHHEYIQVGNGQDVGLNQIAMFEAKVSSGNGEQSLSRDVYRLGQLFDFFRMLSFFFTSVGYYVCTMMTVLVVYAFLYGKAYLALSGVGASLESIAHIANNKALESALVTQFLFQIGVFTTIPMIVGFVLELGVLKACISFITMQLQLCSIFFTFSLGTRTHYFGRTILHGGAKYRATGSDFMVTHIKFSENYRTYSRSHFVKALEIAMLLLVYLAYGDETSSLSYILLSFSSWFLALSWLFAPYIFNTSGFEWQKTVDDFDDWVRWLFYKGGVGVKGERSWEAWWDEEQAHIRSIRGRILETILSLRFFLFQYGVVYHLKAAGNHTNLAVYGVSWIVLVALIIIFKVFTLSQKASVNFQMMIRVVQGIVFLLLIGSLTAVVALTPLTVGDVFASLLAFVPTGWGILSVGIAWKPLVKQLGLWKALRAIARYYDAAMGGVIFFPIALLSWFPFVSTFQTRLLFNQAFSRGLEISLILSGNRPNV